MLLWKKLSYYNENYGTSIFEGKTWKITKNQETLIYDGKKLWQYTKIIELLNRYIALELWFTLEKIWYNGKNYGTFEKAMVLYRKLWNTDLLWKKLWYYGKLWNYSNL